MNKRDVLIYIASILMLLLLCGLVGYLTFIPVPPDNKDIIITVLGVILGGGAAAMPNLFGDKDEETAKLKDRIRALENKLDMATAEYETVKHHYDQVVRMLIDRHIVPDAPEPVTVASGP